jgi:hypothetical protein
MLRRALGHLIFCKEASRLISQGQDRPLGRLDAWKLRLHLRACDACTRFAEQLDFLRRALRRYRS